MLKKLLAKVIYKIINSGAYAEVSREVVDLTLINKFKSFGENAYIPNPSIVRNPQYISIGKNFSAMYNLRIEAWDEYRGERFNPQIIIGDFVYMNTDCHIGCINKIEIGNNVLIASRVYISDHSHGNVDSSILNVPPSERQLVSKGPVIIEDNVWIGEGVCVMPGVTIGKNSIVGANSVVTKSVPANSIIAGVPAKVIKQL